MYHIYHLHKQRAWALGRRLDNAKGNVATSQHLSVAKHARAHLLIFHELKNSIGHDHQVPKMVELAEWSVGRNQHGPSTLVHTGMVCTSILGLALTCQHPLLGQPALFLGGQ